MGPGCARFWVFRWWAIVGLDASRLRRERYLMQQLQIGEECPESG